MEYVSKSATCHPKENLQPSLWPMNCDVLSFSLGSHQYLYDINSQDISFLIVGCIFHDVTAVEPMPEESWFVHAI